MSSSTMPYIIGNWKMNLDIEAAMALAGEAAQMANAAVDDVRIGIAVPFPWIPLVASEAVESELLIGCQDVSARDKGAFTGDVSAAMVAPWCTFAIVGHSERRVLHGETDDVVRAKLEQVLASGMAAVLCVGETQAQRDRGEALATVERQVTSSAGSLAGDALRGILIAYEPVWAIGTGRTPTPVDAQEMAAHIRALLARQDPDAAPEVPILYGGSVNGENAASFFKEDDIDGGLVGGASLDPESFFDIVQAAVPA